jgi:hypothetical protein
MNSLVLAAGTWEDMTSCCCVHNETVGAKNQTSYEGSEFLTLLQREHTFSGGQHSSSAMIRRMALCITISHSITQGALGMNPQQHESG